MTRRIATADELRGFAFDRAPATPPSWAFLAAVVLLAAVLRAIGAAQQSLWTDEVESLKLLTQPGADIGYVLLRNFHGPLHKAFLVVWTSAFGLSDLSVRLSSAFLGTLTVAAVYGFARRIASEGAARWAAVLVAVNPFHIYYSQEVRAYVLLMGFGVVGLWSFLTEVRERSVRSGMLLFLTSAGAALSSFGGLFLIATEGVLALLAGFRRGYPWWRFVVVQLLVVVLLVPYAREFGTTVDPDTIVGLAEVTDDERLRGSHTFSLAAPLHSIYAYSVGLTLGPAINEMHRSLSFSTFRPHVPLMALSALAFGLVGLRGFVRAGRRPERRLVLVLWLVIPIVLTSLLALVNLKVYNVRYPSVGFLAWPFLVALGLVGLRRPVMVAGAVMLLGLSGLSRWNLHHETRYWRPDVRSVAQVILDEEEPSDRILLYAIPEPFIYYYAWRGGGELPIDRLFGHHVASRERFDRHLDRVAGHDGRLWLVRYRSWYLDPRDLYRTRLEERVETLERWRFPEMPLDLYRTGEASEEPMVGEDRSGG